MTSRRQHCYIPRRNTLFRHTLFGYVTCNRCGVAPCARKTISTDVSISLGLCVNCLHAELTHTVTDYTIIQAEFSEKREKLQKKSARA
jgi:ribosomal protein L32